MLKHKIIGPSYACNLDQGEHSPPPPRSILFRNVLIVCFTVIAQVMFCFPVWPTKLEVTSYQRDFQFEHFSLGNKGFFWSITWFPSRFNKKNLCTTGNVRQKCVCSLQSSLRHSPHIGVVTELEGHLTPVLKKKWIYDCNLNHRSRCL